MNHRSCKTIVIGAGIVGIATAYYLKKLSPKSSVTLVDAGAPMALTSAQSGENYRNFWPHPIMTAFTDHSIDLMEEIAIETANRINMNRRGYVLVTRSNQVDQLISELEAGYAQSTKNEVRFHHQVGSGYRPALSAQWPLAPSGVDVLLNQELIRATFPSFDKQVHTALHIRRAGSISGQQMGQYMLERFKAAGGVRVTGKVCAIDNKDGFSVHWVGQSECIRADSLVNAAGPFINDIANMLSTELPVKNTLQQKIAFNDSLNAIPRELPFAIDLDDQLIDWSDEEKALVAENAETAFLTKLMPGSIHCRPDGGDHGTWVKLGWAFNDTDVLPTIEPELMASFPEIVLRGAARLNPSLKQYYDRLPRSMHHYGGYYTLTNENWPLIGKTDIENFFVVGAMSGFGTMAACSAGELCAQHVAKLDLPDYAMALSPQRYNDEQLMTELNAMSSRGVL